MNRQKKTSKKHFQASRKYFSICVYTVATFAICLFIYRLTGNWKHTRHQIGNLLSVFSPFLIAFLIAYFINPMVKHIDNFLFRKTLKDRFRRGHLLLSMILAYIIMIGGIILIFIFIVPQIISSISQLVRISPVLYQNALSTLETLDDRFPSLDLSFISQAAQDFFPDVFDFFRTFMSDTVLPFLYNAGLSIISWFINILLAFVISCYLLFSKNKLIKSLKRVAYAIFPEDMALRLFDTLKDCNQIFSQYIIGKTLDSAIIGVICLVSMTILKLPYALIISLIVGITNMIPYFGPFIGAIPGDPDFIDSQSEIFSCFCDFDFCHPAVGRLRDRPENSRKIHRPPADFHYFCHHRRRRRCRSSRYVPRRTDRCRAHVSVW